MAMFPLGAVALWALLVPGAATDRRLGDWSEICNALENPTSSTSSLSATTSGGVTSTVSMYSTATHTTTISSTVTFTTMTTTTLYEQAMLPVFKEELKQTIKEDGKLLVKDLMSWLITRLVILFVTLSVATPLLILLIHRCSRRCQTCTARMKEMQWGHCKFTACILLSVFLLAAAGSMFLAFAVLDSVDATIKEVRDYYLKTFVQGILADILSEATELLQSVSTSRRKQFNATVCNPTNEQFVMYNFKATGTLEGAEILRARLPEIVRIPPVSLGQLVVNYQILPTVMFGGLLTGVASVVGGSIMSHRFGIQDVALISVLVNTECKVRASRAIVSLKINAPLLLSRLPESFLVLNPNTQQQVISDSFGGPDQALYHIYNALLGGLERYRFFEFESLDLGGPLMIWVYLMIACASLMFVISMTAIVVLLMAYCRRCKRCRRYSGAGNHLMDSRQSPQSPQAFESQLDSVVGRSLGFVEIDIPSEELKPKPHVTRAFSTKNSVRLVQS